MKLTILGCYAATPRTITNPTAQVLEIKNKMFLIDCGEGTQVQLRKNKIKFSKIEHIFISHLHGDHFYGLVGLISTFMLLNRKKDLHIYGPQGIKDIILLQLKYGNSYTGYQLFFHELEMRESAVLYEDEKVKVSSFPLKHRIYTNGFLFQEKNIERKLNIEVIEALDIDKVYYQKIKYGGNILLENGTLVENKSITFEPIPERKYAFCSDTIYDEELIQYITEVDVLYHESTFLEKESYLAEKTMHATAKQAASIAKQAGDKTLGLGHYSTRYENIDKFAQEAQMIFENVLLADDGKVFEF